MSALDRYADEVRWVTWRLEQRRGKPTKVPYVAYVHGEVGMAKADDPDTWATRAGAELTARTFLNGHAGGIGIVLGDLGWDTFLCGSDLDSCLDDAGILAGWAEPLLAAMPTYCEVSPSRRGLKTYFLVAAEHVRPFLELAGIGDPDQWGLSRSIPGERPKTDHGPGIEVYCSGRYFCVTGNRWPDHPDKIEMLDWPALERLAKLVPAARSANGTATSGRDDSRSAIAFRKGIALCSAGKTFNEMCEGLRADPETADWYLEKGLTGGMRELKRIWEKAGGGDKAEIARLGLLPRLEYERERHAAAKRLGIRTSALDAMVKSEGEDIVVFRGRRLVLDELKFWPEAVGGEALLDDVSASIRNYVVMGQAEADVVALWVIAAHAFDAWVIFPRLFITAPEKRCGKTTLLDAISRLVPRPLPASNITASSVFRVIEAARPCLLLDEADAYVRDDEALRSVLNAGHRRDGVVIRTVGDEHEPRVFSVWAPMAIAAIGRLPGTIEDRSITLRLRRRKPDEKIHALRLDRVGVLDELARKAARWVKDIPIRAFADADPEMPANLVNRAADNWRPLLGVANVAGGGWPAKAREAAVALAAGSNDESARTLLLADIRSAFIARNADRISSDELVNYLASLEDRPWPEWKTGKPISKVQVARLLNPLGIRPGTVRFDDGGTAKGYYRKNFDDAFARYVPLI
jgi:putative DNA primase/helicase